MIRNTFLANIYLFKVNNRNIRKKCEIFSKLTVKTLERCHWRRSDVFTVNFENISHLFLVFLFLTLNKYILAWLWLRNTQYFLQLILYKWNIKLQRWDFKTFKITNLKLTHLFPMYPFSTPWKHQKIFFFCFTEFLLNRAFFFRYESSQHRYWSSSHKSYSWNFRKIQKETPKPQCNFIRKRLWNRYSHVKSLKFWGGTMFLAEHLRVTAFVVSFELLHFQFLSCSRKLVLSM